MPSAVPQARHVVLPLGLRAVVLVLLGLLWALSWTASAQAATITQCTRAAVASAVAAGGSHTFACDGRIVMAGPLTVSTAVSLDADGHAVTFGGSAPGVDTTNVFSFRDARVVKVTATGDLTLRGIDVEDGLFIGGAGASGQNGTNGTAAGSLGGAGADAPGNATQGVAAPASRGGCILVEAGGRLVLRSLTVRRCQAASGPSGAGGNAGNGGLGGTGATGTSGGPGENGQRGGAGGPGGNGAFAVAGVPGGPAEGGAIYSAGVLDVNGVRFEDNLVRGGRGGTGGAGGNAGNGGRGGHGGNPGSGSTTIGGDGGTPGAPGLARSGGDGGDAGAGRGGAVYAAGDTSIVGVHFARNTAIGGVAGRGGDGGTGGSALIGNPGRVQVIGGAGDPACAVGGDPNKYRQCGQYTLNSANSGGDGGLNGDGGDGLGGAVFFQGPQPRPVNTTNDGNTVQGGSNLAAECASASPWNGCGTGGTGGGLLVPACFGAISPCPHAPNGLAGLPGAIGRTADADVGSDQSDGLSVTISYEGDDLPGFRLPLDEPVPAQVKVSVADTATGPITGIAFGEGAVLFENEADHVRFTGTDPPAPFTLAPGASRTFDVQVIGTSRGATALRTRVTGEDGLGRTAEAADREEVRVGEDIRVAVTVDPDDVELEVDGETGTPIKKPVTITVALENVAGEDLTDVVLDLRTRIQTLVARNPLAPYPLQITALAGTDGAPDTPLTNATARAVQVGALADQATKTLTFRADAADKARVEIRADATGQAAGPRTVVGTDRTGIDIGQPKLLALTATEPTHGAVKAGGRWAFSGHVQNLSPDEEVSVFVRSQRRENVVEGQISELGDPDACGCGVVRRLEPGERIPLYGVIATRPDGGSRGRVTIDVAGELHTFDAAGLPINVPVAASAMVIAPGADERTVSIDLTDPVTPPFSVLQAAWLMTDGAARTLGQRVTGAQESAAAALAFAREVRETGVSTYLQELITVVREEAPEAYAQARDELVATLLAFDDQLDSGQALQIANEAFTRGTLATHKAWEEATWEDLSRGTGELLATYGPDIALEVALPGIAQCKLLKYGGKSAMLRRAAKLGTSRAGRLLAKGRKGLLPGDEITSLLARKLWGVDGLIDTQLINYAKVKKLMIAVRDRSPGSIRRLAEGMLPKWEAVKAKNVSQLDVDWLGFHPSHLDTAMLKQMPDESVVKAKLLDAGVDEDTYFNVLARYDQRKAEWLGKDRKAMEGYEVSGKIPKPSAEVGLNPLDNGIPADNVFVDVDYELARAGQVDKAGNLLADTTDGLPAIQPRAYENGRFRAMTGDMDPIAFLDENGMIPDIEVRKEIYRDLAKMGFQHPESLTWSNVAGREKYLRDFDLANIDSDALLVYMPDGTRKAGYFDSRKSRLDSTRLPAGVRNGFMAIIGVNIAFNAAGPAPGDVPLTLPPETEPPRFMTPGGSEGAILSSTPGTRLIRRNPDGTFSEWTPAGGWQPYTLPSGETLTTVPQTAVRSEVAAGETRIDISEQSALILKPGAQAWFKPGDVLVIDPGGPNEEYLTVAALGSIIATAPLTKAHVPGEMIALVPRSAPGAPTASASLGALAPLPAAAPKAPRLSAVKLAKKAFTRKAGTTLSFALDRAGTVSAVLTRSVAGRRKGRTCSPSARTGKRCTVQVAAGTKRLKSKAGTTRVTFGKGMRPGTYLARLSAGGNTVVLRFTIR